MGFLFFLCWCFGKGRYMFKNYGWLRSVSFVGLEERKLVFIKGKMKIRYIKRSYNDF